METSELMLTAFVLAFSTVPVYLLIRVGGKRSRILKSKLAELAQQKELIIKHEVFANKIIGLDNLHKLFFITTDEEEKVNYQQIIDLTDLKECQVRVNNKEIFESDYTGKMTIKKIDINFVMNNGKSTVIKLYDSDTDDILEYGHYLEIAKRWKKFINENLK